MLSSNPAYTHQPPVSIMNIKEDCKKNKLTLIAMDKFLKESAANLYIELNGPLSTICEKAGVNRSQVYERKAQLEAAFEMIELAGPGRPEKNGARAGSGWEDQGWEVRERVLKYRLAHPGAMVVHKTGRTTYSDGFVKFILDISDAWGNSPELFCQYAEIPYATYRNWRQQDQVEPFEGSRPILQPFIPLSASITFRQIVEDFSGWTGGVREFFKYETARINLGPTPIRRVLTICGLLPLKKQKEPRYRGSTERCQPGSILVTDGKSVEIQCTGSGEVLSYNWQGTIDQATCCHTAVVITETESADGVREAFDASTEFLGRPPLALLHDGKPIHDKKKLRDHIEKTTVMIPATPQRGQNKAGIEGEFGKFEQAAGTIYLDDSSRSNLLASAIREIVRSYTAGINHAGRAEFDGKSRIEVLRKACPDPEKDQKFIKELHEDHTKKNRVDTLKTQPVSRILLDEAFKRFGLEMLDPTGTLRIWLAARYTPEAIRQAVAIFSTERDKGRLKNKTSHRYLVKVIQNCQEELDLRQEEERLREFAELERKAWLMELEAEFESLQEQCIGDQGENNLIFQISDKAVFGGLALQRSFWENKLKMLLEKQRCGFNVICRHVRRLFEATWENRFALISKIIIWEYQLAS